MLRLKRHGLTLCATPTKTDYVLWASKKQTVTEGPCKNTEQP